MALRFSPARGAGSLALSTAIRGPVGQPNTLSIGTVNSGASPAASITGSSPNQTLNLTLPSGPANSLSIGTVTSGPAAASITGTAPNQTLNLVLQTGNTGATGAGYQTTSTTSRAIASSGSVSFIVASGLAYTAGARVRASDSANPTTNFMEGVVTAYSGTTLTFTADYSAGGGTISSWNINVTGNVGAQGIPGSGTIAGATAHGVGIATAASAMTSTAVMTDGQLLIGQSAADPVPTTVTGDVTISKLGVTAIGALKVLTSMIANAAVDLTTKVTGILPVANGGLGVGTITGLLKGSGTSPISAATAGADYLAPPSGTAILKANSGGALANATAGTDYVAPGTATQFTAQQGATLATLTDATNIAWDVSTRQKAQVTLGGNRTMSAVTNAVEGVTYLLWVIQDGTGSRTLSWTTTGAGSFDFGSAGAPTLTTTASRADILCFEAKSIASTLKLRYVGIKQGFS